MKLCKCGNVVKSKSRAVKECDQCLSKEIIIHADKLEFDYMKYIRSGEIINNKIITSSSSLLKCRKCGVEKIYDNSQIRKHNIVCKNCIIEEIKILLQKRDFTFIEYLKTHKDENGKNICVSTKCKCNKCGEECVFGNKEIRKNDYKCLGCIKKEINEILQKSGFTLKKYIKRNTQYNNEEIKNTSAVIKCNKCGSEFMVATSNIRKESFLCQTCFIESIKHRLNDLGFNFIKYIRANEEYNNEKIKRPIILCKCKKCGTKKITRNDAIQKYENCFCFVCSENEIKNKSKELNYTFIKYIPANSKIDNKIIQNNSSLLICNKCGTENIFRNEHIRTGNVSCVCCGVKKEGIVALYAKNLINELSKTEKIFQNAYTENEFYFRYDNNKLGRVDIFLPAINIVIEIDPSQHWNTKSNRFRIGIDRQKSEYMFKTYRAKTIRIGVKQDNNIKAKKIVDEIIRLLIIGYRPTKQQIFVNYPSDNTSLKNTLKYERLQKECEE